MQKVKFPSGVFVHIHLKGWMDKQGTLLWIDNIHTQRQGGLLRKKSLLVWDMFRAHLMDPVKTAIKSERAAIATIFGVLTLDIYTRCVRDQAIQGCYMPTVELVDGLGRKVINPEATERVNNACLGFN